MIKMDDIVSIEIPPEANGLKKFKVSWKMLSWCNYRCDYCYMKNEVARHPYPDINQIKNIASRINPIVQHQLALTDINRPVQLHLIGGEVSYLPLDEIIDIMDIPQMNFVTLATNLSNKVEYYARLRDHLKSKPAKLGIVASFHLTQCDPIEFMDKVTELNAVSKIVLDESNVDSYVPYIEELLDRKVRVQITINRDSTNNSKASINKSMSYVEHLNDIFRGKSKSYFIVTTKDGTKHRVGSNIELINSIDIGGLDPTGFTCTAGVDGIRFNQKGDVLRAGCRHASIHKIGNIFDEDILDKLPTSPWKCITTEADDKGILKTKLCTCFSNADIYRSEDT